MSPGDAGPGRRPRRLRHVRRAQGPGPRPCALEPGAPAAPDGRRPHPAGSQRGVGRREGEVRVTIPRFSLSHDSFLGRRQPQVPHLLDAPVRAAAGSARDVRRRPRGREHRRGTGGSPSGNGRLPRLRPRRDQARVRRLRHLHLRVRAARAAGLGRWRSRRAALHVVESPTRTSTTTSPGVARVRSHSTGADRPRRGGSTAARCTRRTAA